MNSNFKLFLLGLTLGIIPITLCVLFYFVTSFLIEDITESGLRDAVMVLFSMSSLTVFIISVIFIVHNKPIIGAVALFIQIAQLIIAIGFVSGV